MPWRISRHPPFHPFSPLLSILFLSTLFRPPNSLSPPSSLFLFRVPLFFVSFRLTCRWQAFSTAFSSSPSRDPQPTPPLYGCTVRIVIGKQISMVVLKVSALMEPSIRSTKILVPSIPFSLSLSLSLYLLFRTFNRFFPCAAFPRWDIQGYVCVCL